MILLTPLKTSCTPYSYMLMISTYYCANKICKWKWFNRCKLEQIHWQGEKSRLVTGRWHVKAIRCSPGRGNFNLYFWECKVYVIIVNIMNHPGIRYNKQEIILFFWTYCDWWLQYHDLSRSHHQAEWSDDLLLLTDWLAMTSRESRLGIFRIAPS